MARTLTLLLLIGACPAAAITWEFGTEGDAQGWHARESIEAGSSSNVLSLLRSEVRDGFWRIDVLPFQSGRLPSVELMSPTIGHDSALFDRLSIRFRVVHARPARGVAAWRWTNPANRMRPGLEVDCSDRDPCYSRFSVSRQVTYTTDWQEMAVAGLRTGPSPLQEGRSILWEGELTDVRLDLLLAEPPPGGGWAGGPEDVPEAVEIDRIVLTGAEEQLRGELPPPAVTRTTSFGDLFEPAEFWPLGEKGVGSLSWFFSRGSALGDVDGDGDPDLVCLRDAAGPEDTGGWLSARNDGTGRFERLHVESIPGASIVRQLRGADLDGDGRMEVFLWEGYEPVQVLSYDDEAGWMTRQRLDGISPLGFGDADDDGDPDLFAVGLDADLHSTGLLVLLNDRSGRLDPTGAVRFDPPGELGPITLVRHAGRGTPPGVLWGESHFEVTYLGAGMELIHEPLATEVHQLLTRYVGDFDGDGDVDLVVTSGFFTGMPTDWTLLVNAGDGTFERVGWYEGVALSHYVEFFDLNADGLLDPVLVDADERSPGALVHLGQRDGLPILEGRYPLLGRGRDVLAGDVDLDGDVDLVVLEASAQDQGGVHVLRNRLSDLATTAVAANGALEPLAARLGRNRPNPFNPGTTISFSLPGGAVPVHLQVYNVLGQPVRTLLAGTRLEGGDHAVAWDGHDDRGKAASAGVYFYRLAAGTESLTGKMVKAD